jgi:hypothetical protein
MYKKKLISATINKDYDKLKNLNIIEEINIKKYLCTFLCYLIFIVTISIFFYILLVPDQMPANEISNFDGESLKLLEKSTDISLKKSVAYNFYYFANLSYKDIEEIKELPKTFIHWKIINKGGKKNHDKNYYFVFKNEATKQLVFSFPGTKTPTQLFLEIFESNLKKFDENDNNILISEYFGSRTLDILDDIFNNKETTDLLSKNYSVISTGHSLGGAIAQAFLYFAIKKKKINSEKNQPKAITFSQPRVGNQYFVDFLNKNTKFNLRIKKENDIVPLIPICDLGIIGLLKCIFMLGYRHTENELLLYGSYPGIINPLFILFELILIVIVSLNQIKILFEDYFGEELELQENIIIYLFGGLLFYILLELVDWIFVTRFFIFVFSVVIIIGFLSFFFCRLVPDLVDLVKEIIGFIKKHSIFKSVFKFNVKKEKKKKNQEKDYMSFFNNLMIGIGMIGTAKISLDNHTMKKISQKDLDDINKHMNEIEEENVVDLFSNQFDYTSNILKKYQIINTD